MKIFRIIVSCLLVFIICFTFFIGKNEINKKIYFENAKEYKGVISLWHIDSFEGGVGSRKQFLFDTSVAFEKLHNGLLIMVCSLTEKEANEKLKNGIYPDMISFGNGINVSNNQELKQNAFIGGTIGQKNYAAAWCRGGYFIFSLDSNENYNQLYNNEKLELNELLISKQDFTLPLLALYKSNITAKNIKYLEPLKAYVSFVNGESKYLLGTQRDVIRLNNRGITYSAKYLNAFSDLNQYISITSNDNNKIYYCNKFIDFLLSKDIQSKINKIGMASYYVNEEYEDKNLFEMQNSKPLSTVSAFLMQNEIIDAQAQLDNYYNGKSTDIERIKNLIIIS